MAAFIETVPDIRVRMPIEKNEKSILYLSINAHPCVDGIADKINDSLR
jgi:hypothetical protein